MIGALLVEPVVPVVVSVEGESTLDTWGPGIVGTLLSGVILAALWWGTERLANARAQAEGDRRDANDRDRRTTDAVSALVGELDDLLGEFRGAKGAGFPITFRTFRHDVSGALTRFALAIRNDDFDRSEWFRSAARRARSDDSSTRSTLYTGEVERCIDLAVTWLTEPGFLEGAGVPFAWVDEKSATE